MSMNLSSLRYWVTDKFLLIQTLTLRHWVTEELDEQELVFSQVLRVKKSKNLSSFRYWFIECLEKQELVFT